MSQNYTITGVEQKLWNEFMSACRHYEVTARATFLKEIHRVVNNFRHYKMNYGSPIIHTNKKGKK